MRYKQLFKNKTSYTQPETDSKTELDEYGNYKLTQSEINLMKARYVMEVKRDSFEDKKRFWTKFKNQIIERLALKNYTRICYVMDGEENMQAYTMSKCAAYSDKYKIFFPEEETLLIKKMYNNNNTFKEIMDDLIMEMIR